MGIDCYMSWHGMRDADRDQQFTGFSVTGGAAGYLREAYHGGPYVTRYLVQEAFEDDDARASFHDADPGGEYRGPAIPAATLRSRLPAAVIMAIYRYGVVYGENDTPWIINEPAEPNAAPPDPNAPPPTAEQAKAAAEQMMTDPVVANKLRDVFAGIEIMKGGGDEKVFAAGIPPKLLALVEKRIANRQLPDYCLSFVDFVRLAELKEQETGQPVTVYASY